MNDNGTIYATSTTFSKVKDVEVKVDPSGLVPYTGEAKPPVEGDFLEYENKIPEGARKPENKDLKPGKYLVDGDGNVVLKLEENFPKGARIPPGTEVGPAE